MVPLVNNLYVYRDNYPDSPVLVLHGNGMRIATGSYIGVTGQVQTGEEVARGIEYRVCEGSAYNPENNQGVLMACKSIGSVEGGDPQRASSYLKKEKVKQDAKPMEESRVAPVVNHPKREKWVFVFAI